MDELLRVELTEERREALYELEWLAAIARKYDNEERGQRALAVLRAMLEAPDANAAEVKRLRAVEGELRPTTNRTTQAKVMISQYSEDWHKWADEIAAIADKLEGK